MTDHKGQAVSPYLMKPLRSFQQALAERRNVAAVRQARHSEREPAREVQEPAERQMSHVA